MKHNPFIYITAGALLLGGALLTMAPSGGGGGTSGGSSSPTSGITQVQLQGSLASKTNVYTGNGAQLTNTSTMGNGTNSVASKKEARLIADGAVSAITGNFVVNNTNVDITVSNAFGEVVRLRASDGYILGMVAYLRGLSETNGTTGGRMDYVLETNAVGSVIRLAGYTNNTAAQSTLIVDNLSVGTADATTMTVGSVAGNGLALTNSRFYNMNFTPITSSSPSNFVVGFLNFTNGGVWYRVPVCTNFP